MRRKCQYCYDGGGRPYVASPRRRAGACVLEVLAAVGRRAGGLDVTPERHLGPSDDRGHEGQAHECVHGAIDVGLEDVGPLGVEQHDRGGDERGELGVSGVWWVVVVVVYPSPWSGDSSQESIAIVPTMISIATRGRSVARR